MKTLHLKSIFAFIIVAAVAFTSCKKEKVKVGPNQANPITGSWVGKYGIGNADPSILYSFSIMPVNSLYIRDLNNKVIGKGTWKLEGDNFTGVYTYELGGVFNLKGKYDQSQHLITGSWGKGESGAAAGTYVLNQD